MTDISISEQARICHNDMDRKLAQLDRYIHKVRNRIQALNNLAQPVKGTTTRMDRFIHTQVRPQDIREER
jgi:hypothetical protein